MKLKTSRKTLTVAVATAFGAGIAMSPIAMADTNPFGAAELNGGYMQVAGSHSGEGKCGEGKCGEGKCGEGKCGEGKCGEGKCGEGKCGEGKCGEGKCGEGKCGEGKCGG